ncbi:DUF4192 domain-containing protein [Trebonia kvetii]|uniref:DUF4192 domain-containing protein n=1 Tax=Trebonia kvetii TaxID=2480626 RepID=A0A6P2BZD2_9ACTN|nr:DUF4192 domain-containing protein [Trebonia kvetii]TVZ04444.1 DUF4192 domain-containing protein [Trebonia kvetii]
MTPNLPVGATAPQQAGGQAPASPRQQASSRRTAGYRRAARGAGAAPDTSTPGLRVRIGSPESVLAVIPGLLGFDPRHSFVVIGAELARREVRVTLRYDLPDPGEPRLAAVLAEQAVALLSAQGVSTAVAVGYGADGTVSPVAAAFLDRAAAAGITVAELLRTEGSRYWSYVCAEPACCPPEGTPFDGAGHPAARALRATGSRVLPSREDLAATVAAAGGQPGRAMRRATRQALSNISRCAARMSHAGEPVSTRRLTNVLGQLAVREAIRRYREGEPIDPEDAAWLTVALRQVRVRDDAWARMDTEHRDAHQRLWTDLTRLARPGYVAAPASLLAFVAWQSGDGALANVALDRALADNPRYSMALLLREALDAGAPPAMARLPMTPEEVAAAYDAAEAAEDAELTVGRAVAAERSAARRPGGAPPVLAGEAGRK